MTRAANDLVNLFTSEYMEKVFYFCLKKTGEIGEAEDLSSDIALNILSSLQKGICPERFSAWVWQIARNRYSVWADKKHRRMVCRTKEGVDELTAYDQSADSEEAYLRSEQLSLLRRELAFISSDYRKIVAAYYLDDLSVSQIAASLAMPPGTVMTRLHRARKKLKEGMDMARDFGKKSYRPESFGFSSSGFQPSGLPFSAIQRKIPVNILLHADNNPCTAEELALELGIAMPYMEEEIELLCKAELLKKLPNGKYLTGFFISPKECQNEINRLVSDFVVQYGDDIWELGALALQAAGKHDVNTAAYSKNDAQMFFALYFEQQLEYSNLPEGIYRKFHRADGGDWGFMGLEHGSHHPIIPVAMNNNCSNWRGIRWEGYQSMPGSCNPLNTARHKNDVPDGYLTATLKMVAQGLPPAVTEDGCDDLSVLLDQNFCFRKEDGNVSVNAIVFQNGSDRALREAVFALPQYIRLKSLLRSHVAKVRSVVSSYSSPYLKDDFDYYVAMSILLRGVLLRRWTEQKRYQGSSMQFCAFFC